MLEPEDASDTEMQNANPGAEDGGGEEEGDDDDTSSLVGFEGEPEDDDLSTVRPHSSTDEPDPSSGDTFGDCPGLFPDDPEEIAITQPAFDDAIDLDLHAEEGGDRDGINEDHLLSYRLGQVYASSGLRRVSRKSQEQSGSKSISQSIPQEIDWALFELLPPRLSAYNAIQGGMKFRRPGTKDGRGNSFPVRWSTSDGEIAGAPVHCLGRTSGLGSGVVSRTMELVKLRGRSTFSASWTIADANFGVGGDSGAWVVANDDGRVVGHVLARHARRGTTYICPMDLLLHDIRNTLAGEVVLPVLCCEEPGQRRAG